MAIHMFSATRPADGDRLAWYFDEEDQARKAHELAVAVGASPSNLERMMCAPANDFITDAPEFAHWLIESDDEVINAILAKWKAAPAERDTKVDVLAVMETAGCRIRNSEPLVVGEAQRKICRSLSDELREARAAVLNLMRETAMVADALTQDGRGPAGMTKAFAAKRLLAAFKIAAGE